MIGCHQRDFAPTHVLEAASRDEYIRARNSANECRSGSGSDMDRAERVPVMEQGNRQPATRHNHCSATRPGAISIARSNQHERELDKS
jgi:hypothetical protein